MSYNQNSKQSGKNAGIRRQREAAKNSRSAKEGMSSTLVCPICNAYYYLKSWHWAAPKNGSLIGGEMLCPADAMIKNNTFEGKIIISGLPQQYKQEILNTVKNMDKTAQSKDAMDRVIKVTDEKGVITITTTENQLADKIAKKVEAVYRNAFSKSISFPAQTHANVYIEMTWTKKS